MNEGLEKIVASLELCKLIPAGEFEDSVLVWRERIGNISRDDRVKIREPEDISYKVESAEVNYFPAPTLEEILESIGGVETWDTMTIPRITSGKQNLTTNALRLWFKVKGIEVK